MQPDYNVQIRIKNAWFLRKMREAGFDTVSQLSRACGVANTPIGLFVNLKIPAVDSKGRWRQPLHKISEALKCLPEDLFPPQHIEKALKKNTIELELNASEVKCLMGQSQRPDHALLMQEAETAIHRSFARLTPRQERLLRNLYGFNGEEKTIHEVAKEFGVTPARVNQIRDKALRAMGAGSNRVALRSAMNILAEA